MEVDQLESFLKGFDDSITADNKKLYREIIKSSEIPSFEGYDEYYYVVIYPFQNFLAGFVRSEISDNNDVEFLMNNSSFVECNFENMIEELDGPACCADKSRAIMKRLIHFYKTGERINFDYSAEHTYHLPKRVFKDHDKIVTFYKGIKDIYYGSPKKYLNALKLIYQGFYNAN